MNKSHKYLIHFCLILILCGCLQQEIVDEVNLVDGIGFDHSKKEGEILGTIVFPSFLPDQQPKNIVLSSKAEIKKIMLQDLARQTADPIVTGSIEVVLFGKKLASHDGILDLIDAFQRDPGVGADIYIAIVDGEAKELLSGNYGVKGNSVFISTMIQNNQKYEDLPKTNLQLFLSDFYQEGKTPYLPQLKKISDKHLLINGMCFLRYGNVVHTISPKEMFIFRLLVDKYSHGLHMVEMGKNKAAIQSIQSNHKYKIVSRNPLEVKIDIKVKGIINEFNGNDLTMKEIHTLERLFEKEINEQSMKLIETFKEKNIDPIGFGRIVSSKTRNFDVSKWWETQYKDLKVQVHSDVTIMEEGVID